MPELGTISGQIRLDVKQAIAAYAAMRAANAATLYALRGSSAAFIAFGQATTAAGVGLLAVFGKAVTAAAEFERQMDFFGAVTAATAEDMDLARQEALRLGRDTIFSAGQIADAFVELGKAGVGARDIVDGIGEAVTNLGAAADIPLDQAARIITAAVQTFELGGESAVHVADLLAAAANASIVEVEDLGVSLKYVGGVAASISLPIEDVITALSLLGQAGIRGSTAGTSLRQILVSLTGTSKKAEGVLKDLGIITEDGTNKFFNARGEAKSLSEIFQILQDATEGMSEAQRLAAFKTIFNNRALAAAGILTREGAAGFAEMNAELGKTTAAEVAAKRLDNLSGDLEILRGNIETLFIEAGGPFQEWLRGIVQGVTRIVGAFGELDPATQKLIFTIIGISGAVLTTMGVLSLFIGMLLRLAAGARLLLGGLSLIGSVIGAVGKALGSLVAFLARITGLTRIFTTVLHAAAWAARALMLALIANPVGLVIAAIAALIAIFLVFFRNTEWGQKIIQSFMRFLSTAWSGITTAWNAAVTFLGETWRSFVNFLQTTWNGLVTAFNAVVSFFQQLPTTISTLVGNVVNAIVTWFNSLPEKVGASFQRFITTIGNFLGQLPGLAGYWIGFMVGRIIRFFYDLYVQANTIFNNIVDAIVNWVSQLPSRVGSWFANMRTRAVQIMAQFLSAVVSRAQAILRGIGNWLSQLPGRAGSWFTDMKNRAVTAIATMLSNVVAKAQAIRDGVIRWLTRMANNALQWFRTMRQNAIRTVADMINAVLNWFSRLPGRIASFISGIPGIVRGVFQRAVSAFLSVIQGAFNAAKDFGSALWNGFKAGLGIGSPSFIEYAMWDITATLDTETKRLQRQVMAIQRAGTDLSRPIQSGMTNAVKNMTDNMVREARFMQATREELMAMRAQQADRLVSRLPALVSQLDVRGGDGTEGDGAPLIGVQNVYNPLEEPASQTAARQATRAAKLGR